MSRAAQSQKRRVKGVILIFLIIAAVVLCVCLIWNAILIHSTAGHILSAEDTADFAADCILVLGAGVREDGTPSHMLEDRLKTGLAVMQAGGAPKLLMSGDHGRQDYNEVGVMKAYAVAAGISGADVFMDHAGFSTYESLYRAHAVFGAERVIIVSQGYHLYRALYIARALGIEAVGVSADLRSYAGQSMREVREIVARIKDTLWCVFRPTPTYLGECVSISGDGSVTDDAAYQAIVGALET